MSANNAWVLCYDNISAIQSWLSDALCKISTGGGYAARTLYSNEEETIFNVQRPVILTGISDFIQRPDLLQRSLTIQLEPIREDSRLTEEDVWKNFDQEKSAILGGIFDALSMALRNLSSVYLLKKPRMADFALWGSAAESGLGLEPGEFINAYSRNLNESIEINLESNPVVSAIKRVLEDHKRQWEGTVSDLLNEARIIN